MRCGPWAPAPRPGNAIKRVVWWWGLPPLEGGMSLSIPFVCLPAVRCPSAHCALSDRCPSIRCLFACPPHFVVDTPSPLSLVVPLKVLS